MFRAMLWKEYRDQRVIALVLVVVGAALAYSVSQLSGRPTQPFALNVGTGNLAAFLVLVMAWANGLICGSMLFAGEREVGTATFFDSLPRSRWVHWSIKVVAGLVLLFVESAILLLVVTTVRVVPFAGALALATLTALFVVMGYSAGLLGGTICQTVIGACAVGTVVHVAVWILLTLINAGFVYAVNELTLLKTGLQSFLESTFPATIITTFMGFAVSILRYAEPELKRLDRRPNASRSDDLNWRRIAPAFSQGRSHLWLFWRQSRRLLMWTAIACVPLTLAIAAAPTLLWPTSTILVGLALGVQTFAPERRNGLLRIWLDQRLPLGSYWWGQLGLRAVTALLLATAIALGFVLIVLANMTLDLRFPQVWASHAKDQVRLLDAILKQMGFGAFVAMWLLSGFAVGQLLSLLARKGIVALVTALFFACILTAFWVPELAGGGVAWWHPLVIPLFVLIASRLVLASAAADRLLQFRPLAVLGSTGVLSSLFCICVVRDRVTSVPDERGDFLDAVAEFEARWPKPEANEAAQLVKQAARQFEPTQRALRSSFPINGPVFVPGGLELRGNEILTYDHFLRRALRNGWPDNAHALNTWLDRECSRPWVSTICEAAQRPPGALSDPSSAGLGMGLFQLTETSKSIGATLAARAMQLSTRGDPMGSLELISAAFALARHLTHLDDGSSAWTAEDIERSALMALEQWALAFRHDPGLLQRAAALVDRYESSGPPQVEVVLATYLHSRSRLNSLEVLRGGAFQVSFHDSNDFFGSNWEATILMLGRMAPWERTRARIILDSVFAGWWRGAQRPRDELSHWRTGPPADQSGRGHLINESDWLPSTPKHSEVRERLDHLAFDSYIRSAFYTIPVIPPYLRQREDCATQSRRIQIALLRFTAAEHRPAQTLYELVPQFLSAVPMDPYSGTPFRYRVSSGEELVWEVGDGPAGPGKLSPRESTSAANQGGFVPDVVRTIAPNTGLVWSVGTDGTDENGRVNNLRRPESRTRRNTDIITLVPAPEPVTPAPGR